MSSQQLLLAAKALIVSISDTSPSRVSVSPADAYAGYRLHSDGTIDLTGAVTLNWAADGGTWLVAGANSDFEARATLNSGALDAGSSATGSWLALSTSRAWYCAETGIGIQTANLTVEIRVATIGPVLDTATVVITAEVTL